MWKFGALLLLPGTACLAGDELAHYITRPDLTPPLLHVSNYHPEQIEHGYLFIAPYHTMIPSPPSVLWIPSQIGPHIYDMNGDLVWSGSHAALDSPAFDFRSFISGTEQKLSYIVNFDPKRVYPGGLGVVLDNTLNVSSHIPLPRVGTGLWNPHELKILEHGQRALVVNSMEHYLDDSTKSPEDGGTIPIINEGFAEMDLETGDTVFQWWALDHVTLNESAAYHVPNEGAIELFHMNSVEKDRYGDYLVSIRKTSTLYHISRTTGAINWRLGGSRTSFLQDFNFSSQHDARVLEQSPNQLLISFLDNASNGMSMTSSHSSAMIVALDLVSMKATVVHRYQRPDGKLTHLRGNVQALQENVFVCWSESSYLSEFSRDGRLLMEAKFESGKYATYRAYKSNFTSSPVEQPVLKVLDTGSKSEITAYVSWNGATQVAQWAFYTGCQVADPEVPPRTCYLGSKLKRGFETAFTYTDNGCASIFAQAVSSEGIVLSTTRVEHLHGVDKPLLSNAGTTVRQRMAFLIETPGYKRWWISLVLVQFVIIGILLVRNLGRRIGRNH